MKPVALVPVLGLCSVLVLPAMAADVAKPEPETGALSFVYENDVFYDTDREYTNGVRLAWVTGPGETPDWALTAARWLPFFPDSAGNTVKIRTTYAVGQNMYTPGDITVADPAPGERPYAGWLYGSIGLIVEWGEELNRLDQLDLSVGVVGPASLAEQTQRFVHKYVTNSPDPKGWDTQLRNEPGVVLTYQRSWRRFVAGNVEGIGFDVVPHLGAALGNVYTYANAGLTLRVGADLPRDYGPPRIQPSLPGAGFFQRHDGLGWYLFAGVEGRAVARNIFLDGNTFRDSRSVDREPLVGDLQYGFAITWRNARLSYTHVVRTREYAGENGDDDFGALSLSVRF
jgi:hypothetical protein